MTPRDCCAGRQKGCELSKHKSNNKLLLLLSVSNSSKSRQTDSASLSESSVKGSNKNSYVHIKSNSEGRRPPESRKGCRLSSSRSSKMTWYLCVTDKNKFAISRCLRTNTALFTVLLCPSAADFALCVDDAQEITDVVLLQCPVCCYHALAQKLQTSNAMLRAAA